MISDMAEQVLRTVFDFEFGMCLTHVQDLELVLPFQTILKPHIVTALSYFFPQPESVPEVPSPPAHLHQLLPDPLPPLLGGLPGLEEPVTGGNY